MWTDRSHNAVVAEKDARIAELKAALAVTETRYAGAVAEIAAYREERREAQRAAVTQAQTAQTETRERSQLTTAIREQARGPDGTVDPRLVNHFRGVANQLRLEGATVEEIIERIGQWRTTEPGGADAMTIAQVLAAAAEGTQH